MSIINDIDELLNNISPKEFNCGFNENQWNEIINSDRLITEDCFPSNDIGLSIFDEISSFSISQESINIDEKIRILVAPSLKQRARYKNECKKTRRFISVPKNKILTIEIPDLRDNLSENEILWLRITRITIDHREDKLIFYHPYPLWIRNPAAIIHHGSIFIQITKKDMENRFLKIDNLTMIRLKQNDLGKIKTLPIYSPYQLNFKDVHSTINKTAKQIRDEYNLRYSILHFQLIYMNKNKIICPTNCFCQTECIREIQACEQ